MLTTEQQTCQVDFELIKWGKRYGSVILHSLPASESFDEALWDCQTVWKDFNNLKVEKQAITKSHHYDFYHFGVAAGYRGYQRNPQKSKTAINALFFL